MQSGGLTTEVLLYDIRLSGENNNTRAQGQVSGYSYSFAPEPGELCDRFRFEVKLAALPGSNITAKALTPFLSGLGSPELRVIRQAGNRILVQWQSPARRHQVTLSNGTDVFANVSTDAEQLPFSLPEGPQTIVIRVVPENCPGMSGITSRFVIRAEETPSATETPPVTETPSAEVDTSHAFRVYQEGILAAILGSAFLITGLLRPQ